jgi:polyhydroxyalkanoate synthesis regulator phasin
MINKDQKKNKKGESFEFGQVMSMLENINDGIKILAEDQLDIKKDIKEMRGDISILKEDVTEIKFELKRKVSYDEFEKLERRVIKLEKLGFAK